MKRSGKMRLMTQAYRKTLLGLSAVFVVLFVGMFVVGELMPTRDGAAVSSEISASIESSGYTLSLQLVTPTTPGTVDMSVKAVDQGTWAAGYERVRTTTNSPAGYQLFLSFADTNTDLLGSNSDLHAIPAGGGSLSAPAALNVNHWGYAIPDQTGYDGAFSGDYTIADDNTISPSTTWAEMPNVNAPEMISSVAGAGGGASVSRDLDIYYGVAVNFATVTDTYLGTVLYSAISDATTTGAETAAILPSSQEITEVDVPVRVTTSLLTTTDLGTNDVLVTIGGQTCQVTNVGRLDSTSAIENAVYADCIAPGSATIASKDVVVTIPKFGKTYTIASGYEYKNTVPASLTDLKTLQQLADYPNHCTNASVGTTVTLRDTRDDKRYRVRRLADGKCWMIDNMRLGSYGSDIVLKTTDSNVAADTTIPASAIVNDDTGGSWVSGSDPEVADYYEHYHVYNREDAATTNYGNLYNWYTATAGTGAYNTAQGVEVSSSICPKGWVLPKNASGAGSFYTLYQHYNSSESMRSKTNSGPEFVLSGYVTEAGNLTNVGSYGYFWSRTAYGWYATYSRYLAYYLYLNSSAVLPQYNLNQSYGFAVRCVSAQ